MPQQSDQVETRRQKLGHLQRLGIAPFGGPFAKPGPVQVLVKDYAEGRPVSTAGRLSAKRGHGGLAFADLRDLSGRIQICVRREHVGEEGVQLFDTLDLGDILGVTGTLFKTKTGEVTIEVQSLTLLAKALRPLPEKWHGLKDVEVRYRQRYLDLIANEPVRSVFVARSRLLASLRETLNRLGFLEVETPMMHAIPGGAAGNPFVTHHEVLDADLYLRLAPELHLKELLVGGLERVYELNRSFRNEGVSAQHNPEFTMLEAYQAYGNYETMMELVQTLLCEAARAVAGKLQVTYQGQAIDLTPPWERVSFADAMAAHGLQPSASLEEIQTALQRRKVQVKGLTRSQMVRVAEQLFEPKTKDKPLFVTEYWAELSPLAKSRPDRPDIAERFELFLGGMEVANAYSELNDPVEQRRRFEAQVKGKTAKRVDDSFVDALEYGMPPAGGLGVGVDRLLMVLMDQPSIKDVILFPLLKPDAGR